MKKDYNRDVMSDMPMEASFAAPVKSTTTKTSTAKPKINAIGTQKRTTKSTTTSKSSTSKTAKSNVAQEDEVFESKKLRTKLVNKESDISDLEKLNETSLKTYRFKSKRNRVIIVILSFLLVISILAVVILATITKLKSNCYLYTHGNVDAEFIVNGEEMEKFRTPSNLQGNRILEVDIDLKINSYGMYDIKFIPMCYQKGVPLRNTLIYEHNTELFRYGDDGYYYSKQPISGGQIIDLCGGIILDYEYQDSLNVDNFLLEFNVYCDIAS